MFRPPTSAVEEAGALPVCGFAGRVATPPRGGAESSWPTAVAISERFVVVWCSFFVEGLPNLFGRCEQDHLSGPATRDVSVYISVPVV